MNTKFTKRCFSLLLAGVSFVTALSAVELLKSSKSWAELAEDNSFNDLSTSSKLSSNCNTGTYNHITVGDYPKGSWWASTNRIYRLDFQNDGNLVLYEYFPPCKRRAIWATKTNGTGANFVSFDSQDGVLWVSETHIPIDGSLWDSSKTPKYTGQGSPPFYIIIQNDGNIVIYDYNRHVRWDSGTNPR